VSYHCTGHHASASIAQDGYRLSKAVCFLHYRGMLLYHEVDVPALYELRPCVLLLFETALFISVIRFVCPTANS
jgi:hypothetical protein